MTRAIRSGGKHHRPPILQIEDLTVSYQQGSQWLDAVRNVSLQIEPAQTYGLVGESGSGKSTLAHAILRVLGENGEVRGGSIKLEGLDLLALSDAEMRRVWRDDIKLVPQDPRSSLNPSMRIGDQLLEALVGHVSKAESQERMLELLTQVRIADPERVAASYPHQLSGGMQQRVMIAMALTTEPLLMVLDEPTTNLDVTTEATILDLFRDLIRDSQTAVLYVSHNLGVVTSICDRVAVLYAGELVEDSSVSAIYHQPLHPYTLALLDSVPRLGQNKQQVALQPISGTIPGLTELPPACVFAPRCEIAIDRCHSERPILEQPESWSGQSTRRVRCYRWREVADGTLVYPSSKYTAYPDPSADDSGISPTVLGVDSLEKRFPVQRSFGEWLRRAPGREVRAVDGLSFQINRGRTLGLVGESGSGKTTVARCVIGLTEPNSGEISLLEMPLQPRISDRDRSLMGHLQMVFQNPQEALNPYRTVQDALARPLMRLAGVPSSQIDSEVAKLLSTVKLDPAFADRYPNQLSGGEKQRVAIARAYASNPDLLIFDESVSALDVSVQAAILNLLNDLQSEIGSAYLFISHDLAVVGYLADDIMVMYLGEEMESGTTHQIFEPPFHPYTEALLSSIPLLDPDAEEDRIHLEGDVPSPVNVPTGCRFHTRCPRFLGQVCVDEAPPWQQLSDGHRIHCHIPAADLEMIQQLAPGAIGVATPNLE
ncbi:MAG: ABC transporter ATP-binding protein [Chloroflexota bacterium]|nr:ABC transporter ATP-binding protein [Chloroflexota bacterium]